MPEADWKKCAVWVALPTTQTRESQPLTGNGSREGSCSTSPTSCCSCSRLSSASFSSSVRVCSMLTAGLLGRAWDERTAPAAAAQRAGWNLGCLLTVYRGTDELL